jgi:transposase-like protein
MFVAGRASKYGWKAIRSFYESGHTIRECQERFGFSNGAWDGAVRRGDVVTGARSKPRGATREAVARLYADGRSQTAIARELGISKPTVCFHLRMLGVPPVEDFARRYDWNEIRAYYDAGHSMTECRRRFGFSRNAWWDAIRRGAIVPRPRSEPIDAILAAGRRRNRNHIKSRLVTAGLKELRCEQCGITDWQGGPLSFELHHVNGDGLDNRLQNLLLLCPNCHSQTDTWGGRNSGRKQAA